MKNLKQVVSLFSQYVIKNDADVGEPNANGVASGDYYYEVKDTDGKTKYLRSLAPDNVISNVSIVDELGFVRIIFDE